MPDDELATYIPMNMNAVADAYALVPEGTYVMEVVSAKCVLGKREPKNPMARYLSRPVFRMHASPVEKLVGTYSENFVLAKRKSSDEPLEDAEPHETGRMFLKLFAKNCGVIEFEDAAFDLTELQGKIWGCRMSVIEVEYEGTAREQNKVVAGFTADKVEGFEAYSPA
jgi:hypothetical protein